MAYHRTQTASAYGAHADGFTGATDGASAGFRAPSCAAAAAAASRVRVSPLSKVGGRRRRRSSAHAMNIDEPSHDYQPQSAVAGYDDGRVLPSVPQQPPMQQHDYFTYATTTAQMVDPWAFNHASLLANLSQLPPDLLPSLLPQMNLGQQQLQPNPHIPAQGMSALAAAAAAAAATVPAIGGVQFQPQPQPQQRLHADHAFAIPAVPPHQQQGGTAANGTGGAAFPPMSSLAQQPPPLPYGYANPASSGRQPAGAYLRNVYYSNSSLQPLMVPPPSPTILSYYQTDPAHWMSLLGQNAYQPQAYHYDYPLPPHRLPFNHPGQQQQLPLQFGPGQLQKNGPPLAATAAVAAALAAAQSNVGGAGMLLTQQYTPHPQTATMPVALPPIDQTINQSNMAVAMAAAAQAAVIAAAAANGSFAQQAVVNGCATGFHSGAQSSARFDNQGVSAFAPGTGLSLLQQQQQQQQADGLYQPARRASSFTNLALLQQSSSLGRPEYRSQQFPKQHAAGTLQQAPGMVDFRQQVGAPEAQHPQSAVPGGLNALATLQQQQLHQQLQLQQQQQFQQQQLQQAHGAGHDFGAQVPHLVSLSNQYTGPGAYGVPAPGTVSRPLSFSGSQLPGGLSSLSRISLASQVQQGPLAVLGGPKSSSAVKPPLSLNASAAPYLATPGILSAPASSASLWFDSSGGFVPGTRIKRRLAASEAMRDHILQSAHQLYSANARNPILIDMLQCLHQLHQRHLPTLLLLACAYFSCSQPEKSLEYNELILQIDPNYVEAMSNIGTTLRSMGRPAEAESWWWRAVKLRPGYWDAVENLMGVLCNPAQPPAQAKGDGGAGDVGDKRIQQLQQQPQKAVAPRYREALELCEFVDNSLRVGEEQAVHGSGPVTKYQVQDRQLYRLQSLLYSEGNLRTALSDVAGARREYEKAMEVVLGGSKLDDVVVRIAQVGAQEGINQMFHQQLNRQQPPAHNLQIGSLPLTLLAPENAVRILQVIFPESRGVLPGFVALAGRTGLQQANQVASNLLLTLAKLHQDHAVVAQPLSIVLPLYYLALSLVPSPSTCNNLGIILSAIPSPSTPTMVPSLQGGHQPAQAPMGSALAMQYYTHGLTLDSRHPHLYTNLGSLLKDLGYLAEAVRMYEKAVEFNPTFDVALANLGNAIKDMGRVQESVPWYLRAVQASPNFVEAVCGLANAMAGVCDWRARDGLYSETAVRWQATALADDETADKIFQVMSRGKRPTTKAYLAKLQRMIGEVPSPRADDGTAVDKRRGWMDRVVEIVDQQLSDGQEWGRGLLLAGGGGDTARPSSALLWFLCGLSQLLPVDAACPPSPLARFVHRALAVVQAMGEGTAEASEDTQRSWRSLVRHMRNEGGWALRLAERVVVLLQRQWYWAVQRGHPRALGALTNPQSAGEYKRPVLPTGLAAPGVPTVLPFHTFTYPLDARETRLISHRNALRVAFTTLGGGAPWLPAHVYPPPPPPDPRIRIGYVSSDFNNHPLSHLMQSVFGMHDRTQFEVYCYATTPSDGTEHRQKIEGESDVFLNCAAWSTQRIVEQIVYDKIHVLVNLNGYTKGARNEIFAARPAPVLVAFMGFAGTLGAGWCDYVVTDPIVCPPWTVRSEVRAERRRRRRRARARQQPEMLEVGDGAHKQEMVERAAYMAISDTSDDWRNGATSTGGLAWDGGELNPEEDGVSTTEAGEWVYTERMIYMPHTYFVNDHRQGFREDEELRDASSTEALWLAEQDARYRMRREVFPQLAEDVFIFANFNQLYKIDPTLFRLWLRILERVPNAIIWLLRFPAAGEEHLHRVAVEWAGKEIAQRVVFTDVAPKHMHIKRGRVADAFLDTTECNAHTTAVDILWSGTPVLTWPRHSHKLCSRVAASVVCATGQGRQMVVGSADEYVERAVEWATQASHEYQYHRPRRPFILDPDPQTGYVKHRLCHGPTMDIRLQLFLARDASRLFDTQRWTRNLERGLAEAWRRWVTGEDEADDEDGSYGEEISSGRGGSNGGGADRGRDAESRRRARWCWRIEEQINGALAAGSRCTAYAPAGGSIWVRDEDDGMPSQTWVREMLGW
ncbi:hypothetical protein LPJ61_002818 [Coemansia biformis]|uniref:protein O-GlcNAc transferase n=1 Tax=Coemansia biformis TaxID=1286918 RepID=A0A9W8CWU6_9FUNG|nr:hypothetical protein LPJ61_002818 [Coemansia biformis]